MTGGAGSSAGQDSLLRALPQTSEAEIAPLLSETAKTKLNLHAATAGLQAQVGDLLTPPTQKKKKKRYLQEQAACCPLSGPVRRGAAAGGTPFPSHAPAGPVSPLSPPISRDGAVPSPQRRPRPPPGPLSAALKAAPAPRLSPAPAARRAGLHGGGGPGCSRCGTRGRPEPRAAAAGSAATAGTAPAAAAPRRGRPPQAARMVWSSSGREARRMFGQGRAGPGPAAGPPPQVSG